VSLSSLCLQQVVEGVVVACGWLGVWVDIGLAANKHALLHITTVREAYRPRHVWEAEDVMRPGQKVTVVVTRVETEKGRVRLGLVLNEEEKARNRLLAYASDGASSFMLASCSLPASLHHQQRQLLRSPMRLLSTDLMGHVLSYCSVRDLSAIGRSCSSLKHQIDLAVSQFWIKEELVCFHSKRRFTEDTLGFGIRVEYFDDGEVAYLHPRLDLLSHASFAWEHRVRFGAYDVSTDARTRTTHWLPLYLTERHARQLTLAEFVLADMCRRKNSSSLSSPPFHPLMALKLLSTLLNTMVVQVMKGATHESLAALQGYCAIYHLLVSFALKYPEMVSAANQMVRKFLANETGRNKRNCPSLGEWLCVLSISDYSWEDVASTFLRECFDRNVKWVCEAHPELVDVKLLQPRLTVEPEVQVIIDKYLPHKSSESQKAKLSVAVQQADANRLPKTFQCCLVSLRLVLFHVYFLHTFRGRQHEALMQGQSKPLPLDVVKAHLDGSFGRASHALQTDFQRQVKRIKAIDDWMGFFAYCRLPMPKESYLLDWLQQSVFNSARKRYHDQAAIQSMLKQQQDDKRKAKADEAKQAAMIADGMIEQEFDDAEYD